jgi:hypothetical protein
MVFVHVGVLIGEFKSKTTAAVFLITVPVGVGVAGRTVYDRLALLPGGRKPARGSVGGNPVVGSIELQAQVIIGVLVLRDAPICTSRFVFGRRSTVALNGETNKGIAGGVTTWPATEIGPGVTLARSTLAASNASVITTVCAGAVALELFSNVMT